MASYINHMVANIFSHMVCYRFVDHETKFWLPLSTQGEIQIGLLPKFWTTGVVPEGRSIEEAFMLANGIEVPSIDAIIDYINVNR